MKRSLIAVLIAFALTGCEEKETGLQKSVINATYEKCLGDLKRQLKSPRSLIINDVIVATYPTTANDVYRTYGDLVIADNGKEISSLYTRLKTRFREIGASIDYEAQNSFGVFLPSTYSCSYVYMLTSDEVSPDELKLLKSGDLLVKPGNLNRSVSIKDYSNFKINNKIKTIVGDVTPNHMKTDDQLLQAVLKEHQKYKL